MEQLQGLIDALTTSAREDDALEPTAFFTDLDDDTLASMRASAADAFTALQGQRLTEDVVGQMETLAEATAAIGAESERRNNVANELASRAAALAERITPPAAEQAVDSTPVVDATPEVTTPEVTVIGETELVTASAPARVRPRVDLNQIRSNAPAKTAPRVEDSGPTIRVASDLPGFATNSTIDDISGLTQAVRNRFASFPIGTAGVQVRGGIVDIHRNYPAELTAGGNRKNDADTLEFAADESRLPGGSLLAAANTGWCVPREIDYTLCAPLETLDGLVNLPTVAVRPPGITYPGNIPWWQLFDFTSLREFCAPELCGVAKPFISIPCPDWVNTDVCVEPFAIESCILAEKSFPQWTELFVRRSIMAFRRWQNIQTIKKMLALVPVAHQIAGVNHLSNSWSVMDSISYFIAWFRDLHRMGMNATLEMIAPHWLRGALRDDFYKKSNMVGDVTDADIDTWFANRGVRVQFVYDWQSLTASPLPAPPQEFPRGADPVPPVGLTWPTEVKLLLFPAGTFISGRAEVFRMDGMYDAASVKLNKYTKIFFEDSVTVYKRCYEPFLITIPLPCASGAVGPRLDLCATP
jgi:hypothetical protein